MRFMHKPVLLNEVLKALDPKPGEFFIDGTVGEGGHAASILEKMGGRGKFLGIDLDGESLKIAKNKIEVKFGIFYERANYADIPAILKRKKLPKADGLLLDLGFSSSQIDEPDRGFSFRYDAPLDMRYGVNNDDDHDNYDGGAITAAEVLNNFSEDILTKIFRDYGEERYARFIAKKIIERRKQARIVTTTQLSQLVEEVYHSHRRSSRRSRLGIRQRKVASSLHGKHPATRVFQALRIFVNNELGNLEKILVRMREIMSSGGRVAIISFHSLEDRLVKRYFGEIVKSKNGEFIFKKAIKPTREEIAKNPRSRSAKLRAMKLF